MDIETIRQFEKILYILSDFNQIITSIEKRVTRLEKKIKL